MTESHKTCGICGEWIKTDSADGWVPVEELLASEADLRYAEGVIAAHNGGCQDACGHGELEAVRCGWRPYFAANGRRCPYCPVLDMIDYKRLSSHPTVTHQGD